MKPVIMYVNFFKKIDVLLCKQTVLLQQNGGRTIFQQSGKEREWQEAGSDLGLKEQFC